MRGVGYAGLRVAVEDGNDGAGEVGKGETSKTKQNTEQHSTEPHGWEPAQAQRPSDKVGVHLPHHLATPNLLGLVLTDTGSLTRF